MKFLYLLRTKINNWRTSKIKQRNFLIYMSVLVGLMGGLAAVALKYLVQLMEELGRHITAQIGYPVIYIFLPALGILLTVVYQHLINRDRIEKGIGSILLNIKKNKSNISYNNTYSHLISSSLTVGLGGSSGLEAPIVCTGAAIGSNAGRFFNLTAYEKNILLAAGASAGIAAVFNSPIAGVLFSLEILLGEIAIPVFIPLLIASATGVVVAKVLNSRQLFHLVTEGWAMYALPFYLLLGVLSGWLSVYVTKVAEYLEKGILLKYNRYVRALAGGIILGAIIFIFPPLLGEGYHYVQECLNGNIEALKEGSLFTNWLQHPAALIPFIAALVLIKIVATGITLGSGGNGGTFAPTMFTGAFMGLLIAYSVNQTGLIHLSTSNFMAVGMAGALSGVLHAPLTAIFLIAEITGGYVLFIPLMIVSALSYVIARVYNQHNMYWHALIHDKHVYPDQDYGMLNTLELQSLIKTDFTTLKRETPLTDFYKLLAGSKANIYAVTSEGGKLEGVILLDEIRRQLFDAGTAQLTVGEVMTQPPAVIDHLQPVTAVMELFDALEVWRLPVTREGKFIGFISKSALLNTYRQALIKQHKDADLFV